jgi:predicted esterase
VSTSLRRQVHRILLLAVLGGAAACMAEPEGATRRPRSQNGATANDPDEEDETTSGTKRTDGGTPRSDDEPGGAVDGGAGPTPGVNSTKGTGGPTGQSELTSTGGLGYMINAPPAGTKPRGLLVLLHGSTASNYKTFVSMMATVATKHDLIRVSVLAPNKQGWNEGNQQNAAALLHRVLQEDLFPKYDIDLSRVFFSGQSSGGGFLSSHFLPLHAKDYRGGAFMQCGAAPPFTSFTPDAATKQGLRLHFEITTGDTIWPTSYANAVTAYTNAGMSLTKDNTKTGGHCAFDQQQVILDRIATMLPAN